MDSRQYSERLLRDLTRAGERFSEPAVREAYAALVRALEQFGEGELYEDAPLTRTQLAFMESALPGLMRDGVPHSLQRAHRRLRNTLLPAEPGWRAAPPAVLNDSVTINVGSITDSSVTIIGRQVQTAVSWQDTLGDAFAPGSAPSAPQQAPEGGEPPVRHDVFISYSHRDGQIMRVVSAHLRASGLSVWTDHNLTPGEASWIRAIEDAIRASTVVAVLVTPNVRYGFVEKEVLTAQAYNVPIVPLLCRGDERSALSLPLRGIQYLDCRDEHHFRRGLQQLTRHVRGLKPGAADGGAPLLSAGPSAEA